MRQLTEAETVTRTRRRQSWQEFVSQSRPTLEEFAMLLQAEHPTQAWEHPDSLIPAAEALTRDVHFDEMGQDERRWLQAVLIYLVGQVFIRRHGGLWTLEENPDSKFFLRYVVGFMKGGVRPGATVDPSFLVEVYLNSPPGRSLTTLLAEAEQDIKPQSAMTPSLAGAA